MMRPVAALLLIAMTLAGCDGDDSRAVPHPSTTPGHATGAAYVYRLDTFDRVYEAFVTGRVPLGLVNEVTVALSGARIVHPTDGARELRLSLVAAAPRDDFDVAPPVYEWWFVTRPDSDDRPLEVLADTPELRIAARNVAGVWGVYVDEGLGWTAVNGDISRGEHEVSARLRIAPSWPLVPGRVAYMRAVVRHVEPGESAYDFGWVYPEDLAWLIVTE